MTRGFVKGRRGLDREEFRKFKGEVLGEFGGVLRRRNLDVESIDVKFCGGEKFQYYGFPILGRSDVSFCGFTVNGKLQGYGEIFDSLDESHVWYSGFFRKGKIDS